MPLHLAIFLAAFAGACGYALLRGGRPEKFVALTMVAGVIVTRVTSTALSARYRTIEWPMMIVDLAILAAFVAIAIKADRRWPMAIVAIHALSVGAHVTKVLDPRLIRTVYWMMTNLWIYPQLALLTFGTWRHRVRLGRDGVDPDWSRSLGE